MKGQGKVSKKEMNRIINGRTKVKPKDKFNRKSQIQPYKRQNNQNWQMYDD